MLLPWLILIPFIGGFLCWQTERFGVKVPRWIALVTMGLTLALSLQLWLQGGYSLTQSAGIPQWQSEFDMPWIPRFGISIHLAIDGLSLLMVVLTGLLGVLAVLCSWKEIEKYQGFFHRCHGKAVQVRQILYFMGNGHRPMAIAVCFHHGNDLRLLPEIGFHGGHIVFYRIQIHRRPYSVIIIHLIFTSRISQVACDSASISSLKGILSFSRTRHRSLFLQYFIYSVFFTAFSLWRFL